MSQRVLIVQSDIAAGESLARFFTERGDQVWQAEDAAQATQLVTQVQPDLLFFDLHLPGMEWVNLLREVKANRPTMRVVATNKHPDFQREMFAREQGVEVFLRQPFTRHWITQALARLERGSVATVPDGKASSAPRVRLPVRIKITAPYMILALLFALVGAYLVSQVIFDSLQERFTNQLISTGKQASDWMVQEENRELESLRLVANTQGVANALKAGDAETLRQLILPVAVNYQVEAVELLDAQGVSVLSLRHPAGASVEEYDSSRGENVYAGWDFVRYVLDGRNDNGQDKQAGLARAPWGDYFYVSGPVKAPDGSLAGVVLVGRTLTSLVRQMRDDTLGEVTFYDLKGNLVASTLFQVSGSNSSLSPEQVAQVLGNQDKSSLERDLDLASSSYSELLSPWDVRGNTPLGIRGVAMARVNVVNTSQVTRTQIFLMVVVGFLLVLAIGFFISNQITRPLLRVVKASSEVARGNLEVKVDTRGDDEVAILAHSFNRMVAGLQEGSIYRDLLGRTVSPEVREQLRETFTSGTLRLEGQEAVATVLITDIRGFTTLSERVEPATVFNWLNEYFSELVPIVTAHNGVVNKFDGDAMLAFYGILPRLLSPKQSAFFSCRSALKMLKAIEKINLRRVERGEPPLSTGIGINTGVVTAGGLGTSDRMHYTIIGDTVNTAQRLETLTRQLFNISAVVISQSTYTALGEYRREFRLDPLGAHIVKGKTDQLQVYRLLPLKTESESVEVLA
jgi:class 3 adenylate cyclase/CheY-like chemotaxis protein